MLRYLRKKRHLAVFLPLVAIFVTFAQNYVAESKFRLKKMTKEFSRLPETVKPVLYDVHLTPNFETFKFEGHLVITCNVIETTSTIVMNSAELEIKSAKVGDMAAEESG